MAILKDSYIPAAEASSSISKQDQLCQTFTTTSQYRLDYIELLVSKRLSGSGGTCQVNIYATAGGKSTGNSLSYGSIAVSALSTSAAWKQISMVPKAVLSNATVYAIVINMASSPNRELKWYGLETGTYADGTLFRSYNTGSTWSDTGQDFGFKTYGNDPEPAKATTPMPVHEATSQPIDVSPTWIDGDPYTDTFDVYFDKDTNPPTTKVIDNEDVNIYDPPAYLDINSDYYWRVDSKNAYGTTTGDVWKFTTGAAIPISNATELQAINDNLSASYYLTQDIDVSEIGNFVPLGNAGTPFTGIFNGKNFTISNLTISRATTDYQGLFGVISTNGLVCYINLISIDVEGDDYVGGLVGYAGNCTIYNCAVAGAVAGNGNNVGGCIGYATGSANIDICYSEATVTNTGYYTGGFVGFMGGTAVIDNCYASGNATSSSLFVGGFVGGTGASNILTNCYSIGAVSGSALEGGFCGSNSGTITGCYYDSTTSGQSDTGKGIPKITAEMKQEATFENWDFSTPIWHITEDVTYPQLTPFPPDKAANPTPENDDTEVDFSGRVLNWDDSARATSYDVYMGPLNDLSLISEDLVPSTLTVDLLDIPKEQVIYWKINAKNVAGITIGDVWNFDARPGKPTNPSPTHEVTNITLDESPLSWVAPDPNIADTYEIYFREQGEDWELVGVAQAGIEWPIPFRTLNYGTTYEWRIDAINLFGATEGDTWDFDTIGFYYPTPSSIGDNPTGENNMVTLRRLVVAVEDKIWYEDI